MFHDLFKGFFPLRYCGNEIEQTYKQWTGVMNGENPRLKNPLLPWWVQSCLSSASSTQHMWELLAENRTVVLPRDARGRRIMGLVYVCPLL